MKLLAAVALDYVDILFLGSQIYFGINSEFKQLRRDSIKRIFRLLKIDSNILN